MRLLHYLEIENFKRFGENQRIELEHPTVLIGPNNCGKTSAIQALALWSMAIKNWYAARKESSASDRIATPINRLNIVAVPVTRTRFFWNNARVRTANTPIMMTITVGLEFGDTVQRVSMKFRSQSDDLAYCEPADDIAGNLDLIQHAASINVELLYPMSGIETEEPVIKPGRMNVLLGQGQTAQVLRNLCLMVHRDNPADWDRISDLMRHLFHAELQVPIEDEVRGIAVLSYRQPGVKDPLDIAMSGRGFQQLLLLFSYLFSHKRSVLLIDEPDAHLEILRQRQVYVLLRDVAHQNGSQVILVTHSEVILNEAIDTNLTLILDGKTDDLAKKDQIRNALKHFGAEHYVRAREAGHIFYVEGSTDIDLLKGFAKKLQHPVSPLLEQEYRLNPYYLQDNYPESERDIPAELDRVEGGFGISPKEHFYSLKKLVGSLRGLAIHDSDDGSPAPESLEADLRTLFWKRYEPENYFITPDLLASYGTRRFEDLELFAAYRTEIDGVLEELLLERVFDHSREDLEAYQTAEKKQKALIWRNSTIRIKLSSFAEEFFRRLSEKTGSKMLLRKGNLHLLIEHCDPKDLNGEVIEKLDALMELLS